MRPLPVLVIFAVFLLPTIKSTTTCYQKNPEQAETKPECDSKDGFCHKITGDGRTFKGCHCLFQGDDTDVVRPKSEFRCRYLPAGSGQPQTRICCCKGNYCNAAAAKVVSPFFIALLIFMVAAKSRK